MSANTFIMAIVILGLALLFAVAVIVVLFILLREAYREISSYYVPVSLPEIRNGCVPCCASTAP